MFFVLHLPVSCSTFTYVCQRLSWQWLFPRSFLFQLPHHLVLHHNHHSSTTIATPNHNRLVSAVYYTNRSFVYRLLSILSRCHAYRECRAFSATHPKQASHALHSQPLLPPSSLEPRKENWPGVSNIVRAQMAFNRVEDAHSTAEKIVGNYTSTHIMPIAELGCEWNFLHKEGLHFIRTGTVSIGEPGWGRRLQSTKTKRCNLQNRTCCAVRSGVKRRRLHLQAKSLQFTNPSVLGSAERGWWRQSRPPVKLLSFHNNSHATQCSSVGIDFQGRHKNCSELN